VRRRCLFGRRSDRRTCIGMPVGVLLGSHEDQAGRQEGSQVPPLGQHQNIAWSEKPLVEMSPKLVDEIAPQLLQLPPASVQQVKSGHRINLWRGPNKTSFARRILKILSSALAVLI
jgi:hypothetical protein